MQVSNARVRITNIIDTNVRSRSRSNSAFANVLGGSCVCPQSMLSWLWATLAPLAATTQWAVTKWGRSVVESTSMGSTDAMSPSSCRSGILVRFHARKNDAMRFHPLSALQSTPLPRTWPIFTTQYSTSDCRCPWTWRDTSTRMGASRQ